MARRQVRRYHHRKSNQWSYGMTVSSSTDRATFPGNGVATAFSLPFRFFANSDVVAQAIIDATGAATPLTLGIDYLLTGAGQPEEAGAATGVLTTLAPVPAGVSLFIQRIIPATQPTDIVNQGRFFPEVHETVFDRLTMLVQQNEGSLGRALRVQDYDPLPARLPSAVQRANRILSFDVNGDPVAIDAAVDSALALRQDLADPDIGSGIVFTKSTLALAVSRSVGDKLRDVVSIRDFGPTAGTGDAAVDTAALQAAVNSGARGVYLPSAKYRINSQITSSLSLRLYGDGPANSRLCFEDCNGFNLTPSDRGFTVEFDGVGVLAASRGLYTAVVVDGQNLTRRSPTATFTNCAFNGADVYETGAMYPGETLTNIQEWFVGIDLVDAGGSLISECSFVGKGTSIDSGFDTGTTAIVVRKAMHLTIWRCFASLLKYGVTVGGRSEGFHLLGTQFVGLHTGLTNMVGVGTNTSPNNFIVDNCHFDTTRLGVHFGAGSDASQVGLCAFSNTLYLRRGLTPGYAAMDLLVNRSTITSNVIQTNDATTDFIAAGDRGVIIRGIENVVSGNIGRNCGYLVELTATSARNNVTSNTVVRAGTATTELHLDGGASNVVGGNVSNTAGNLNKQLFGTTMLLRRSPEATFTIEAKTFAGASLYDSRIEFAGGTAADGQGAIVLRANALTATAANFTANVIRPGTDNASSCGTGPLRWSVVYSATGAINTSDARTKQQVRCLDSAERAVALKVKSMLRAFKFNDAVEKKGEEARIHFGVLAQDVKQAFEDEGLVAENYAMLCYDEWEEVTELLSEDGEVIRQYQAAGNRYGIRYEQLLAFIISAL
jgi:hypothetical protein